MHAQVQSGKKNDLAGELNRKLLNVKDLEGVDVFESRVLRGFVVPRRFPFFNRFNTLRLELRRESGRIECANRTGDPQPWFSWFIVQLIHKVNAG
jgi:hypothetical protein